MSVISLSFLLFLSVSLLLYYTLPKKTQTYVLLAASTVFYTFSGIDNLLIVVITTVAVYFISQLTQKNLDETVLLIKDLDRKQARIIKDEMKLKRKKYLIWSLVIIIGVLAVLKYISVLLCSKQLTILCSL